MKNLIGRFLDKLNCNWLNWRRFLKHPDRWQYHKTGDESGILTSPDPVPEAIQGAFEHHTSVLLGKDVNVPPMPDVPPPKTEPASAKWELCKCGQRTLEAYEIVFADSSGTLHSRDKCKVAPDDTGSMLRPTVDPTATDVRAVEEIIADNDNEVKRLRTMCRRLRVQNDELIVRLEQAQRHKETRGATLERERIEGRKYINALEAVRAYVRYAHIRQGSNHLSIYKQSPEANSLRGIINDINRVVEDVLPPFDPKNSPRISAKYGMSS